MAFTRAQAKDLLNQTEMALYDDSRINSLRGLAAKELEKRIERARKARDRARDLLQRQKLASRARAGGKRGASGDANQRSKRKGELLADILKRFEGQRKIAAKQEKQEKQGGVAALDGRHGNTKTGSAVKTAGNLARKAGASKPSTGKSAGGVTKKPAGKQAKPPPGPTAPGGKGRAMSAASSKPISTRRALANTRKLLEAKQARDRSGQPWQRLDPQQDHQPQGGYQSGRAAEQAEDLHAGESRIPPIQGSISTRDRKHQGRRDHRG